MPSESAFLEQLWLAHTGVDLLRSAALKRVSCQLAVFLPIPIRLLFNCFLKNNRNSGKNEARQTCAVSGFNWHYSHKMHLPKKESDWQGTCASIKLGGPPPCVEITRFVPPTTPKMETRWRKMQKSWTFADMQGNLKGWWKDFKGWRILHCIACICMFHHLDAFTIERICLTGDLCFYKIGGGPPPCVEITRFVPPTQQKVETRWRKYAKSLKVCRYAENLEECWKDLKGWRILHCIACICMFHHLDAFTIERICLTGDLCFYKIGGGHPPVWK